MVARGRWVGACTTPLDQGGIGIGQVVPRGRLNLLVRDLSIREVALHDDLILSLCSVGACVRLSVLSPSRYESTHTHRRGHPEIRVVELFITERQSNEVLNDDEERQKEGEYRSTNHKAYQSVLRKALLYS